MRNIFDYLNVYGDVSFKNVAFNSVDSLICSLLSYVEFQGIVSKDSISLNKACKKFLIVYKNVNFKKKNWLFPNSYHLIQKLEESKRYSKVFLSHYVNSVNDQGQFCALKIRIEDASLTYLSFCGTDSNVIGWKEDFDMVCNYPIYSQVRAKDYYNQVLNLFDRNIYVGGHSKGGNLAMYAYMYGNISYKKRTKKVYNFDGPGFLEDVLSLDIYKEMSSKLVHVVPENSLVGILLYHDSYLPVRSAAKFIMQHDAYSWECFGGEFIPCTLSSKSRKFRDKFYDFLEQMTMEEKQEFVDHLYKVFVDLKITNIMQLQDYSFSDFLAFIKELSGIPSKTKKNLVEIIKLLIGTIH